MAVRVNSYVFALDVDPIEAFVSGRLEEKEHNMIADHEDRRVTIRLDGWSYQVLSELARHLELSPTGLAEILVKIGANRAWQYAGLPLLRDSLPQLQDKAIGIVPSVADPSLSAIDGLLAPEER